MCHLVVITEKLSAFRNSACSCRFREVITHTQPQIRTHTHTHALHTCTHYLSHIHTSMHLCFGLCFELIPATGEAHRKLADNNIILWPSYGNMALLLWRNMNIMAFRGSLGNYMAVMLLSFNGIFRFSIYPASLGGESIKLFTFATTCPGLLYIYTCDNVQRWDARHILRCRWVKVTAQWDRLAHIWIERILWDRPSQRADKPGHSCKHAR